MNASPAEPEKKTLTDHLRARGAVIIDPAVTGLARLHVSPNLLTVAGMLFHLLFAWLIANDYMQPAGIAIFLIVPLDALDGALARKTGRDKSSFGAFLDSTSDRIAEIILFAGYLVYFTNEGNLWLVAVTYLALTGSLMVSYTRSRAEALGLSCKVGLFTRVERYVVIVVTLLLNRPEWTVIILAVGVYFTVAQRVIHVWNQTKSTEI